MVLVIGLKVLAGGVFVVLFSLISHVLRPKMFSGLFSAAPSVALAGLLVTALASGAPKAAAGATGMLIGVFGMVACCIAAVVAIPRLGAIAGSAVAWATWFVASLGLGAVLLA